MSLLLKYPLFEIDGLASEENLLLPVCKLVPNEINAACEPGGDYFNHENANLSDSTNICLYTFIAVNGS